MLRLNNYLPVLVFFLFLSGCREVGDLFGSGIYVGAIILVLMVAFIIWVVQKLTK